MGSGSEMDEMEAIAADSGVSLDAAQRLSLVYARQDFIEVVNFRSRLLNRIFCGLLMAASRMPPRLARSSVQSAAPKTARNKTKKRNLNAYAIASHSAPARSQVKQHRLGEYLDDRPAPKRRRDSEDDDVAALDDEDVRGTAKRRKATFDDGEGDIEEGSDSEGNEWTLGGLAEDDEDSDLDSEEAFGESDEEKFEDFTFRGSKSGGSKSKKSKRSRKEEDEKDGGGVNLDEDMDDISENDEEEDDFGDEGVDLATMLDDEDDEGPDGGEEGDSEENEDESASQSDSENDDADEGDEEERNARMRDRLEALDGEQQVTKPRQSAAQNPLSVDDLLADLDPSAKKQFAAATKTRKRSERPTTLAAPLPKRQQDRLNREVASQKAKEQLDRWRDTIIQNRRAEFLSFPLKTPDQGEPLGKDKFLDMKPQNELEANIQRIMEESGMASKDGQNDKEDEEDALMKAEGMAEQNMDVDEVMRRRVELRKARELLFYEERKAKRIAKIKSKSYRRVHRKEKARQAERDREEREALGLEPVDEDEREKQDRKRAEERMGTKHRDSKWAKQLKQTDRAAWDEGARDSMNEEARQREELRRRVEGREIGSDESEDEGDYEDEDEDEDEEAVTLRELNGLKQGTDHGDGRKGLAGMKFMRDADARRKAENDDAVERMRKELAIEDGDEAESGNEIDDQGLGRAVFGPQGKRGSGKEETRKNKKTSEMEEGSESEGDVEDDAESEDGRKDEIEILTERRGQRGKREPRAVPKKGKSAGGGPLAKTNGSCWNDPYGSANGTVDAQQDEDVGKAWFDKGRKKAKKGHRQDDDTADLDKLPAQPEAIAPEPEETLRIKAARPDDPPFLQAMHAQVNGGKDSSAGNTSGWTLVKYGYNQDVGATDSNSEPDEPVLTRNAQNSRLQRQAFAADDVEARFQAEKAAQEESEDEKETSSHLPGWGSWTGSGLSKSIKKANEKAKHNPLFKTKTPGGVKRAERQDAKLPNVIVSEKKQGERKGKKYLAGMLPQGFERKEEYERSLRRPIGGEWGTKEVVQRNTRPRVVVKKGTVFGAMERPMV